MPEETKHIPSQDAADSERSGDRRLSTCSPSSDTPETDAVNAKGVGYAVRFYAMKTHARKLERERDEALQQRAKILNILSNLVEATDRYGMAASMTHPRLTRAISAARSILPENVKSVPPADEKTPPTKSDVYEPTD